MIRATFSIECPYCQKRQSKTEIFITSQVDGDWVIACENCEKRLLVHWFLVIDGQVEAIKEVNPPVRCSATIEPFDNTNPNDDDDWIDGGAEA
jgi:hypothetical protein